jgi:hypothetical protein
MPLSESDTRAKLIDPAIHGRGWTEDLIRREETAGTIELGEAGTRRQPKGRVDYVLRVKVTLESQPVAVALIEAKAEHLPPTHGLEQAKLYAEWCTRNNRLRSDPYAFKCTAASGRSALLVRDLEEMRDYDLYDVLAELGYGLAPKTRIERADAFTYKHAAWLSTMPSKTAGAIRALAGQFALAGTEGLENPAVFQTPQVAQAGGLAALKELGRPAEVLMETKTRMFAA